MRLASIPESFLRLHRDGRFDYWGAPYRSLTDEQREARIKTHLTEVLWWQNIEWDREPAEIAAFEGNEFLRPGLYPFAGNGFGDEYCWYPRWQTGPEPPVVLFVHDEEYSHLFARTFTECLYRCLLEEFANDEDRDGLETAHITRGQLWSAHREILRPVLDGEQNRALDALGPDPSPDQCGKAAQRIAAAVGDRRLIGAQQPTRYNEAYISDQATLLRLYDGSIAFYRELIESEGRVQFQAKLDEARAARAEVAGREKKATTASRKKKPTAASRKKQPTSAKAASSRRRAGRSRPRNRR